MKNKHPFLLSERRKMITAGDTEAIQDYCEAEHPAVIAEGISAFPGEEIQMLLRYAAPTLRANIFSHLDEDLQLKIFGNLKRDELARLLVSRMKSHWFILHVRYPWHWHCR